MSVCGGCGGTQPTLCSVLGHGPDTAKIPRFGNGLGKIGRLSGDIAGMKKGPNGPFLEGYAGFAGSDFLACHDIALSAEYSGRFREADFDIEGDSASLDIDKQFAKPAIVVVPINTGLLEIVVG